VWKGSVDGKEERGRRRKKEKKKDVGWKKKVGVGRKSGD